MIIFSDPAKPFSFNVKGLPRRAVVLKEYQAEIEALYDTIEDSADIEPPLSWSPSASLSFIRAVMNNTLTHPIKDDDDVFEHGCDRYVSGTLVIIPPIIHGLIFQPSSSTDA